MANMDEKLIKKLKRGEIVGKVATIFCGAMLSYFFGAFITAFVNKNELLKIIVLSTALPLMVIGIAVAVICTLKYNVKIEEIIKKHVVDTFVENAQTMHPERDSLTFFIGFEGQCAEVQVNGYKEKIIFDFSPFGKLQVGRKLTILTAIETRLCVTFCRLYDNGSDYKSVEYTERAGTRRKKPKAVKIIENGAPNRKAYKTYLKNM